MIESRDGMTTVGVIGGSGLYDLPGLENVEEVESQTPFGAPSSPIIRGRLGDMTLLFLARHGRGHTLTPTEVPYRANIFALRELGASHLLSISAVGSLRRNSPPGSAVLPDQIIDRTLNRSPDIFRERRGGSCWTGGPILRIVPANVGAIGTNGRR
jgi:5'-methylthioadenosine phosphorylase